MYLETSLLLGLFILMIAGFRLLDKSVFSPWMVTLGVWVVVLALYVLVDHGLYDVDPQLVNCLLIWVCTFSLSSYAGFRLCPNSKSDPWEAYEPHVNIILILCLLVMPFAAFKAVQNAMMIASPEGLFYTLREQMVDSELYDIGVAKYFVYVIYVVFIIEANRPKIIRWRFTLVSVCCLLFMLISMSKTIIFMYAISGMFLLYVNKKISLRPIVIFFVSFLALGFLLQLLRGREGEAEMDSDSFLWMLSLYIISPMQAFGTDLPECATQWGEYTFRTTYSFLNHLGFQVDVVRVIEPWVFVPIPTNVYTIMSPYFRDFGYEGVFWFALLEGFVIGMFYRKSDTGSTMARYLYTYILVYVFLQFFQENFFLAFSSFIYITALLLFCHTKITFSRRPKNSG